jgi:DNA-binding MarR family transcriptional regulator
MYLTQSQINGRVTGHRARAQVQPRRIGALHDQFLGRNRPLGESRLLYEIGTSGADVRELRARLGIDSGYFSRMLRSLESQGLVTTRPAPGDARMRRAELTATGKAERRLLDRRSDQPAAAILVALPKNEWIRLLEAMADVERILLASEVTIEPEPADSETALWCLNRYFDLLNERLDGGYSPANAAPAGHADFAPPNGIFLVA